MKFPQNQPVPEKETKQLSLPKKLVLGSGCGIIGTLIGILTNRYFVSKQWNSLKFNLKCCGFSAAVCGIIVTTSHFLKKIISKKD